MKGNSLSAACAVTSVKITVMYKTTPTLHMSDENEALVQFITSGDINSTVPQIEIGIESDLTRLKSLARPKSMILSRSGMNDKIK